MKIRKILSDHTEPQQNIALEHAIHHLCSDQKENGILRFWKNSQSVVIGRIQDIHKEVNLPYCQEREIPVLRRISGGGTVYHDLGNLNTSIVLPISKFPEKNVQSMSKYMAYLMKETLIELGIESVFQEGGTNLFFGEKKISGSAGHLRKGWFLHHATLLFNSDIEKLNRSILVRDSYPEDPKMSRYFETVNLEHITEEEWIIAFSDTIQHTFDLELINSELRKDEIGYGTKLENELYSKKSWNYEGKRKLVKP